MLFNGRNDAIKFIEGYSSMILEAKKILQKNQHAQVKAGNNSENLLNKIREIVIKYNNITKSVQL